MTTDRQLIQRVLKRLERLEKKVDAMQGITRKREPNPHRKLKNKILGNRVPSKSEFHARIDQRLMKRA